MHTVIREIHFSYGHRILGHSGKCARLHGHNGRVQIEIASEKLDALGMVVDFYEIRRRIGAWIDEHLDHRMILNRQDPAASLLQGSGENIVLIDAIPTAEVLAKWIFQEASGMGFSVAKVTLWETENSCATYYE